MEDHNNKVTDMGDDSIKNVSSVGNNDGLIDLAHNISAEHSLDAACSKTVNLPESVNQGVDVNERDKFGEGDLPSGINFELLVKNDVSAASIESGNSLGIQEAKDTLLALDPSGVIPMDQDQDLMVNDSSDVDDALLVYSDCLPTTEDEVECDDSAIAVLSEAQREEISSIPVGGTHGIIPNESECSMDQSQDSNVVVNGPRDIIETAPKSLPSSADGIIVVEEEKSSPNPKKLPSSDSALGVLSNYGNDSCDSDDNDDGEVEAEPSIVNVASPNVIPLPIKSTEYRTIQPSSDDSDSDSSESSEEESTSGSSSESIDDRIGSGKSNKAAVPVVDIYDEAESADKPVLRTKGEATLDDLPPIADLHISVSEDACMEMGVISSIVEQQVVVQAKQNFPPMNLDTVLFLEKGKRPLGVIFDVFGQVTEPFYSVRFNSADHVKEKRIETGMAVYCAPHSEHTNYVFVDELLKMKGSDASWRHNNETPSTFLDFSDDEAEQHARRQVKGSRAMNQSTATDSGQPQRKRVNSFERRMNERNLQKSALPPEPRHVLPTPPRASGTQRGKRVKSANPFSIRGGRGVSSPGPVFPSPNVGSQPSGHQPRPPQHGWEWMENSSMDQSMGYGSPSPGPYAGPNRSRGRAANYGTRGRGYGFGPVPTPPMTFGTLSMGQGLPQHENQQHMRFGGHHSTGQPGGPPLALAYSMGHHMQPTNNQSMVYPSGMMQGAQRPMYPVLLRPATFQSGPPRYEANSFGQNMPFGSPPHAFPPCFSNGPPQPPIRGQSYNPMFSGVPMFNPGFPPPQLPPRAAMYPIGPPPPPRGGV